MYDIIGDIHGHADTLEVLLQKMGYKRMRGVYRHPQERKVVFVGDFIDRGPKIRETLHLVRDMCEADQALAVMGNHEYNAICFHTPHTQQGGFFRSHTVKEINQHIETLRQFAHFQSEWDSFLGWFGSLPLYLDMPDFRVVHACWDQKHIDWLTANYTGMTTDFLSMACDREHPSNVYQIVEETLKGKEYRLPDGRSFTDKDGTVRQDCRMRWWASSDERTHLGNVLMECPEELKKEAVKNPQDILEYRDEKPVFFGHYWLKGKPSTTNSNAICLDYSVAKDGILVACRLHKEKGTLSKTFVY